MLRQVFLLFVWLRVPVHVDPAHRLGGEERAEMSSELLCSKFFQKLALLLLSVEDILVGGYLVGPVTVELLIQVEILLGVASQYGISLLVKLGVGHLGDRIQHLAHMPVEAGLHVRAAFLRRLNEEPGANNVPLLAVAGEDHITKLLNRTQLVKSRLVKELKTDFVQQL